MRFLGPVSDYLEQKTDDVTSRISLRPPGAIEESDFLSTCLRCGACVDVCPADAISLLPEGNGTATGTPMIDPDRSPCVICEGLQCTNVCQSGALVKLTDPRMIDMGIAQVYEPLCIRSQGEPCTECIDLCPVGSDAIRLSAAGMPEVLSAGCVGCGVCQFHCPTSPKAITIVPR